ncbi:hypothetical protein BofuT4_uP061810.1 [Botrytis cinerea T4]|uniref:Uncharacterized protein n=1 Tax=Botryotinia fuckeliana (strain T4) TaxID=999810 RepID=G2XU01_BOTF4|nr:hypothetical protein BofuT4_uP061810.1 [Botrytis cinerea T4]
MAHGIVFLMVFCLFNFSNKITIKLYDYAKSPSSASFLRPFASNGLSLKVSKLKN